MAKRIFVFLTVFLMVTHLHAQQGLHIDRLFQGQVVSKDRVLETKVRGKALSKYGLSFYRSIEFEASASERYLVEQLLDKDRRSLKDKADYRQTDSKRASQRVLQLPMQGGNKRLLCYKKRDDKLLVIYLEGPNASFETLKSLTSQTQ